MTPPSVIAEVWKTNFERFEKRGQLQLLLNEVGVDEKMYRGYKTDWDNGQDPHIGWRRCERIWAIMRHMGIPIHNPDDNITIKEWSVPPRSETDPQPLKE